MTLIFDYAGPAFVALIVFLIFYFMRPIFITDSNRIFLLIVLVELLGFTANMLSSYADNNGSQFCKGLLILFNSVYYAIYILRYFLFSIYFSSLLQVKKSKNVLFIIVSIIVTIVTLFILTNPWTEFIYTLSPEGVFNTGKLVILIYVSNISTVILDVYYFTISFKKTNYKDKINIMISIFILLSCCFFDFFYMEYVISDIFFLLIMAILYLTFENPEIYFDKKTGMLNIQAFKDAVSNNLFKQEKYSTYGFSIKNYNELKQVYGTKQIDIISKKIGNYLLSNYSNIKSFYLHGGRFAIIEKNKNISSSIVDKIKSRFEQPWQVADDISIKLNIMFVNLDKSINFSSYNQITACVELAVIKSKQSSNDDIVVSQEIYDEVLRKRKILQSLNKALREDSLKVFLQPIIDANSKKIIAAEALVRLYDSEFGIISPVEFIAMAERNGYIEKLGEQVLNKVCLYLHNFNLEKYGLQWINVNLSPIQCLNDNLLNTVNKITLDSGVNPKFIHLEITEESIINKKILKSQINNLINNGYEISLDDFGSGFSSLYSIKAFPFSNIKLDITLIREHFKSPDNMLPGIVKIFRDMGLTVTAEGVETEEMAEQLKNMGCNYLQGYYFSKPVPIEEFLALINKSV